MSLIRLQKFMADRGICSRRKAEELILSGQVTVNGETAKIGMKVDGERDRMEVVSQTPPSPSPHRGGKYQNIPPPGRGRLAFVPSSGRGGGGYIYIALNKPIDYICSASDEQGLSVLSLLRKDNYFKSGGQDITERVYPVGRLDKDSEGLVLLTNDGELTNKLTHPRYEHEKEYEVTLDKRLESTAVKVLEHGMDIGEGEYVQGIEIKKIFNKGRRTIVNVILKEGKNRQIRRMFARLGYQVVSLRRIRIGKLKLNILSIGKWKLVKKQEII